VTKSPPDEVKPPVDKFIGISGSYRKIAPYLNVGYVWAASVIIFTIIGIKLDKILNTEPWLTLAGALMGVGGGFYHFLKTVLRENNKKNNI
jgi:F0F1-type ATP synthase assembly protein I